RRVLEQLEVEREAPDRVEHAHGGRQQHGVAGPAGGKLPHDREAEHGAQVDEDAGQAGDCAAHSEPPMRAKLSALSPSTSPQVRKPDATSSSSAKQRSAAASRSSRPAKTGLASKSICSVRRATVSGRPLILSVGAIALQKLLPGPVVNSIACA